MSTRIELYFKSYPDLELIELSFARDEAYLEFT